MANETCSTAMCQCSMGMTPTTFNGSPFNRVLTESKPAGNIMDIALGLNFPQASATFGQCFSLGNPTVLAATIAAGGVLQPQTCTPFITSPWVPGSPNVLIGGMPALSSTSQAICNFAGNITIIQPGEFTVMVP
ncbi:MAG: DUF4280 domain-containing protein [Alphaproteobacteria bacterium]|nr:DUF4280 domain-containing protein [Alphaproteobacteria bacterium]